MLSELLWGCWLSTGMRTPEAFGLFPYMKNDHIFLTCLFSACRIVTESIFTMQTLPTNNKLVNKNYNIEKINSYIKEYMRTTFLFRYMNLLNVNVD